MLTQPAIFIDGRHFHTTFGPGHREAAERAAKVWGGQVEPFGIRLNKFNPATGEATDWEKTDGFSVWL